MLECPPNQELIRPSLHIPCEITDGKPNGRMSACQIRAVCTVQMCLNFASARLKIARLAPDRNWFEASCAGRRVAPSAVPSDVSRCQFRFYNNTTMPPFFFLHCFQLPNIGVLCNFIKYIVRCGPLSVDAAATCHN